MAGKIDRVRDVMSGIETSDTPAEEKPERLSRFNQGVIAEMSRQLGRGPARAA
ncbi:MAG TPA: hypothetical protein VFH99_03170 [Candidatus Saccharimonadales bacterium]|nr:hypothetical protein [Candidatus Saccharimonadales bacterium]